MQTSISQIVGLTHDPLLERERGFPLQTPVAEPWVPLVCLLTQGLLQGESHGTGCTLHDCRNKPDGQYEVAANVEDVAAFVTDLPIRKVPGIGKVRAWQVVERQVHGNVS